MMKCEICGREYKTETRFNDHMDQHKSGVIGIDGKLVRPRTNAQDRKKRVPLGTPHLKMTVSETSPGKKGRWVNDTGGRVQQALAGGYEFKRDPLITAGDGLEDANTDIGSAMSQVVGTKEDHSPQRAYYMEIDQDLYDEDQAEKMSKIDEVENAILEGKHNNATGKHGYIPDGGNSIGPGG